jgi:hypothetical protein
MAVILDAAGSAILDASGADINDESGAGGWLFTGPETLVYPSYIDTQAGHTLVAVPLNAYQMEPAGLGVPVIDADNPVPPPDGLWQAAD